MSKREKIEPNIILTIDIHGYLNITFIIKDKFHNLLHMSHVEKTFHNYTTRKNTMNHLAELIQQFNPDTIIYEQNQLFIDKIDLHPDPLVLRNVLLGYSIKTSIEDKYYDTIKYILEIPEKEWRKYILNHSTKYSIDLYKSHVLEQPFTVEQLQTIELHNYYKALCLSESIWFDRLIDRKYQINKGD